MFIVAFGEHLDRFYKNRGKNKINFHWIIVTILLKD